MSTESSTPADERSVQDRETVVVVGKKSVSKSELISSLTVDGRVRLTLDDGLQLTTDRIVCATGFEPIGRHPLVDRLANALDLVRGARGLPVLDDESLACQTVDGRSLPLYVSGALALGTVGPYAPNLPGARRAADWIIKAVDDRLTTPPQPIPSAD